MQDDMRRYVESELQPLWQQFQPSEKVQVLYGFEQEPNGPTIPLALAVTYLDEECMKKAMDSKARSDARNLLPAFQERFFEDVCLWHYVFRH